MCDAHAHGTQTVHAADDAAGGGQAYAIKGMTCTHCALSVTEEVEKVPGVTGIDVDLEGGRIVVRGDGVSDEAIAAAVDEAGYELAA